MFYNNSHLFIKWGVLYSRPNTLDNNTINQKIKLLSYLLMIDLLNKVGAKMLKSYKL